MSGMLAAIAGITPVPVTAIEDVFSAYTYTGNGATQTITNGIDLAGKGGMVWIKSRNNAGSSALFDTTQLHPYYNLTTVNTTAEVTTYTDTLTAFTSTGFTLGADTTWGGANASGWTEVAWAFAQAAKFYKQVQVTVSGSNQTVDLSSLGTVGMVTVKRTDSTSAWYTLHRSNTAGKLCYLNTTAAETTDGSITLSGTTLTLVQSVIGNGTFIVYAWAHDTSANGLIQCGTYTVDGSVNASITTGWEPGFILIRDLTTVDNWYMWDGSRGLSTKGTNTPLLSPNLSSAESSNAIISANATGFYQSGWPAVGHPFIYMAIRRGPMKLPTVGTQVYNAIARTGTGAAATVTGVGFPPDSVLSYVRTGTTAGTAFFNRLIGGSLFNVGYGPAAETTGSGCTIDYGMDGFAVGADTYGYLNKNTYTYVHECFRRYPGVFDEVCFTSVSTTNQRIAHNLTVVPELIITKSRSGTTQWFTYSATATPLNYYLALENTQATTANGPAIWGSSAPTATDFGMNNSGTGTVYGTGTIVAYLFATLAGISKVGSYTGNGSSLTLNMGFSAGARFFMCKRTDSTGDWFVWDSTRGIIAGNDPHLSLNTTAAEVTTDDSVDPDNSGIIVNEIAATHINVNAATYIYLAFA